MRKIYFILLSLMVCLIFTGCLPKKKCIENPVDDSKDPVAIMKIEYRDLMNQTQLETFQNDNIPPHNPVKTIKVSKSSGYVFILTGEDGGCVFSLRLLRRKVNARTYDQVGDRETLLNIEYGSCPLTVRTELYKVKAHKETDFIYYYTLEIRDFRGNITLCQTGISPS